MGYSECFYNLSHGTNCESADNILKYGFEIRGDTSSWCGKGVYFYDLKSKAWWSANRTCTDLRKRTGVKHKPIVIFADVLNLNKDNIFDLRAYSDLQEFKHFVEVALKNNNSIFKISELKNDEERIITFRSMLISYFADNNNKKLIIGTFKQREQNLYKNTIDFANSLNLLFGFETIYCVKDINIISNIRLGGV